MTTTFTFIYAVLGGILPAMIWLWFWLREDKLHPEPKKILLLSFIMGLLSVIVVLPIESYMEAVFHCSSCVVVIILWAITEEIFKFSAAYISALRTKNFDEPIDAMIYLITAALGFAAFENTLFLITPIYTGSFFQSIDTANLRFVGASLLHVITSGVLGTFIALTFYKSKLTKRLFLIIGVILAVVLHVFFNLSIINSNGDDTFFVFFAVWIIVIILLLIFEKIKKLKRN